MSIAPLGIGIPAATAGMFDKIPALNKYQEGSTPYYQRTYDDAESACASVASQYNTWVAANPNAPPHLRRMRLNPRPASPPGQGLGCLFDLLHLEDEPPSWHAGDLEPDRFHQNAIYLVKRCPSGYTSAYYSGPPQYHYCSLVLGWTRECGAGNCPAAGKPAIVSAGMEILTETDVARRGSSSLEFTRYYRSSPTTTSASQARQGRLGYLWTDTYSRTVKLTPGNAYVPIPTPTIVTVTRPSGHEVMFLSSAGAWAAEGDISDRLTQQLDGSGNTTGWQYQNASDESIEYFDATGKLLSITGRNGVTQTLTYSISTTSTSVPRTTYCAT